MISHSPICILHTYTTEASTRHIYSEVSFMNLTSPECKANL
uniref:Uncharacterized protein n=1 Tax=Arundo donax TaxID=35708 RepID=A0A0A9CDH4_ARUDO